jgi:hypothetical protein
MVLTIFAASGSAMTETDFLRLCSHERHRKHIVFTSTLILIFSFALKGIGRYLLFSIPEFCYLPLPLGHGNLLVFAST